MDLSEEDSDDDIDSNTGSFFQDSSFKVAPSNKKLNSSRGH